jgi:hypothetical protein
VLKATEKDTKASKSECSEVARDIVDTNTPRMTAHTLVNELVSFLYPCHSDVGLYRPTSVVEMVAVTIDMIRTNHSSTESTLNVLLHLRNLTEHVTYQQTLIVYYALSESKNESVKNKFPHDLWKYKFSFQAFPLLN